VLIPVGSRNQISELLIEKCVIGLYLLYTSQNLLGTIFRVTFAVLYRRIWSIAWNYSILCCDTSMNSWVFLEWIVKRISNVYSPTLNNKLNVICTTYLARIDLNACREFENTMRGDAFAVPCTWRHLLRSS
jgi:hypothetical protein